MNTSSALKANGNGKHPEHVEQRQPTVTPYVDVFENANEILLWADVPGAATGGVEVHLENGRLTLSARRAAKPEAAASGAALQTEQRAYDYHRVFTVPADIDPTKIEAELRSGVLKVKLPKSEALKPRRIEVKAS
jgi:HSP20 family molecular chaperone IbpA